MEKLSKIILLTAISILLIFFGLFLVSALPHIIENTADDWEKATRGDRGMGEAVRHCAGTLRKEAGDVWGHKGRRSVL